MAASRAGSEPREPPGQIGGLQATKVAIIGAGISGLYAACCLLDNGIRDVVILEAQAEVGGRIKTLPCGRQDGGFVELGAQWIHGKGGNAVYHFCLENGVALSDVQTDHMGESVFLAPEGQLVPKKLFRKSVDRFWSDTERRLDDEEDDGTSSWSSSSFGAFLREYAAEQGLPDLKVAAGDPLVTDDSLKSRFFEFFLQDLRSDNGCSDLDQISLKSLYDYHKYPEGPDELQEDVMLARGFRSVLDVMVDKLSLAGIETRLRCPVEQVRWAGGEGTTVKVAYRDMTDGGDDELQVMEADHVFCTISLGCMKAYHRRMFRPSLPEATLKAVDSFGFGRPAKIFLEFDCQALPPKLRNGFCLLWPGAPSGSDPASEAPGPANRADWVRGIYVLYKVLDQPSMLQGWVNPPGAEVAEALEDEELLHDVQEQIFRDIIMAHGSTSSSSSSADLRNYPPLKRVFVSRWSKNPWILGAYTFQTMASFAAKVSPLDLSEPLFSKDGAMRVQFCGEATDSSRFSTTDGALRSAKREVDRLINYLKC